MKLAAVPVVIRRHPVLGIQVHAQTRRVINKGYDPLYDGTEETCGETVNDWESIIDGAIRGVREELGLPDLQIVRIIGGDGEIFSTRPEDKILGISPYYFVQQLIGPQPWAGLGIVVVVPSGIEFQIDKEGEVSGHRWWKPEDLLKALQENPSTFMGFHYPVLLKVCQDIIAGRLPV